MSETSPFKTEQDHYRPESLAAAKPSPEHLLPTAEQAEPLRPGEKDPLDMVAEARAEIKHEAIELSEANPLEKLEATAANDQPKQPLHVNAELKAISFRQAMHHIRRKESLPQRTLSKVIHQPVVRAVSEVTGKTLSRPSGLLGGGLVALMGTSTYLYMAKHLGFDYNYFVFLLLFVVGFAIGIGLELLVWLATSQRRHAND